MRAACALVAAWLPIAVIAGGCGGPSKPAPAPAPDTTGPEPAPPPDGVAPEPPDEGAVSAEPAAEPLTEAQCVQMVDHMIDVQLAALEADPDKPVPPPDQVEQIRAEIKADFVPQCQDKFTRAVFDCWLAAKTAEEFEVCAGGREDSATDDGA